MKPLNDSIMKIVPLPEGSKAMENIRAHKIKTEADGFTDCKFYKAILVAQKFSPQYRAYYHEMF